ncbi:hypothetical protein [Cutibacterium avidum]|uniref:hypothetical protein n=1 Tax=Cutibacterium avidum TaxID=33010 RepID=UPI00211BE094|nr:hypothetical protein [Cutibacterium avidum]
METAPITMRATRNRHKRTRFATCMVAVICLITASACGKVRTSSISEADTLHADVRIATSWSQPDSPIFDRPGLLSLDGDTTHELKKLDNAPRYTSVDSDSNGNVAFIDFSNMYVMGKSGTRIIPRKDPYVSDSQFIYPYPLGAGEFAFLSNWGDDSSNPDRYTFLLEFTDGTSMHIPHWVSDITMCNNQIYGISHNTYHSPSGVQFFRIDRQHHKTVDLGPLMTPRWGLTPESGLACHGKDLVVRLGATSWNKKATYPQTTLAFFDLKTGSARQIPITDEHGKSLNTIDGGGVREDSMGPTGSDAVIMGHEFIWTLLSGQVVATDLTTGKSRLIVNTHLAADQGIPLRIQGKTVGVVDTATDSPVIRLYDLETGAMIKEVDPSAAKKAQERSGGIFTGLFLSGFALVVPR